MDPFNPDLQVRQFAANHNILYQAYSSLGTQWRYVEEQKRDDLFASPLIKQIAQSHNASEAQVLLRWALQQGVAVIPRSSNPTHILQNIDLDHFELSNEEIDKINSLNKN